MQDSEKGGAKEDGPPTPVGFWDPKLKHIRHESMSKWLLTTVVLMCFILSVLSIYWAVFFHVDANLSSLVVYIVDFDGKPPFETRPPPFVGPMISELGVQMIQTIPHLGYGSLPASQFNNDPIAVRQAVYNWDAWAAIIINPNATSMLYSAIRSSNSSYDPFGACQLIFQTARDDTSYYNYVLPQLEMFMTEATSMVGQEWARMVAANASDPAVVAGMQAAPQALSPAIGFSRFDLRPFHPYTATPTVSIGLIYLIILSFFSFSFYLPIHMKYLVPKGHPPLKFWQLIVWRWVATITAYLFLSLAYSLISLAFQINFSGGNPVTSETEVTMIEYGNPDAYGRGTFPVYWMLNYWGMFALGLACENVAMIVGQPWTGLWLIFWVITNVSTAFYAIDIEPRFYYLGYAFPLHQVVEGSRQILFDLHSRIGLNFGILIAWAAVNTAFFPLCCYWMRFKNNHGLHEYWA
ncbi:hypothetical protein K402DRAFT_410194 [Aulographum hederae CBS 113979]|uniref:DUF3533 domain-containing protein n=1 Tax=Aulographum hederae CBS 113979 TaxID=1176131 RepID=A0A6G1HBZ4_9PEZI|nr:hypothetical protein K402DRAFT_410194 [Aulographum hederae CBS 113979]